MIPRGAPFPPEPPPNRRFATLYCPACCVLPPPALKVTLVFTRGAADQDNAHDRLEEVPFFRYICLTPGCGYAECHPYRLTEAR